MSHFPNKNYFTMPNEIFSFGLDASEIAVYAYLRCLESRSTYQCWPSYTTIGNAVGRAKNTVMRYVDALAEKGLVSTEPTSVLLSATRLLYRMGNIFRDNAPVPAATGVQIDRKRLAQLRQKRVALGHKPDDHELEQQQGYTMQFR